MSDQDWDDPWERSFAYVIEVGEGAAPAGERVMVLLNPAPSPLAFALPQGSWRGSLDTAAPEWGERRALSQTCELAASSLCVLAQATAGVAEASA